MNPLRAAFEQSVRELAARTGRRRPLLSDELPALEGDANAWLDAARSRYGPLAVQRVIRAVNSDSNVALIAGLSRLHFHPYVFPHLLATTATTWRI